MGVQVRCGLSGGQWVGEGKDEQDRRGRHLLDGMEGLGCRRLMKSAR
jgi:hypothetical protein